MVNSVCLLLLDVGAKWCMLLVAKGYQCNGICDCNNLRLSSTSCCQAVFTDCFTESSQLPSAGVTSNIPSLQVRKLRPRRLVPRLWSRSVGVGAGRFNSRHCLEPVPHHRARLCPAPVQTLRAQRHFRDQRPARSFCS